MIFGAVLQVKIYMKILTVCATANTVIILITLNSVSLYLTQFFDRSVYEKRFEQFTSAGLATDKIE